MLLPAILINVFEVPAGKEEDFITWWDRSSEELRREPGFIDAKLHRSVRPGARFQFINIAHWETTTALEQARDKHASLLQSLTVGKGNPAFYEIVSQY